MRWGEKPERGGEGFVYLMITLHYMGLYNICYRVLRHGATEDRKRRGMSQI